MFKFSRFLLNLPPAVDRTVLNIKLGNRNLTHLFRKGDVTEAFRYYKSMKDKDIATYTTIFIWCVKHNNGREANNILTEMNDKKIAYDPLFCTYLIEYFSKYNMIKMVETYNHLKKKFGLSRVPPITYSIMLNALFKENPSLGMDFLEENLAYFSIDSHVLSSICQIFAKNPSLPMEKCLDIVQAQKDLELNEYIYNPIIQGYLKRDLESDAFKILNEMKKPSILTYNIFIKHYCDKDMELKVEKLLSIMEKRGIPRTDHTNEPILRMYARNKKTQQFLNVLVSIEFTKDTISGLVNTSLTGLAEFDLMTNFIDFLIKLHRVGALTGKMTDSLSGTYGTIAKYLPNLDLNGPGAFLLRRLQNFDPIFFNRIVEKIVRRKSVDFAWNLFQKMNPDSDILTYNTFMSEYYLEGNQDRVKQIFKAIPIGLKPNDKTIQILGSSYLKRDQVDEMKELIENHPENLTLKTLLAQYEHKKTIASSQVQKE